MWFERKTRGPRHANSSPERLVTIGKRLTVPLILALAALTWGAATAPQTGSGPRRTIELAALKNCGSKPDAGSTGASGTLIPSSQRTVSQDGQSVSGSRYQAALTITADRARLSNVQVDGTVLVLGDGVNLDHVTARSVVISGASDVTVSNSNLSGGSSALQVTADRGPVSNVILTRNYVHDLAAPQTSHSGTHVRGATGLRITCSNYQLGAYGNAAVFLENANGGTKDITLEHNWLGGGGFTLSSGATGVRVANNIFEGGYRWGLCRNASAQPLTASGNVLADGSPVVPCGRGGARAGATSTPAADSASSPSASPTSSATTSTRTSTSATTSPSSSATRAATSTSTRSAISSAPVSTASGATSGCAFKPSSANTGAGGARTNSGVTTLGDGQSLSNVNTASLVISGNNVTLRNVKVNGRVLVRGSHVLIDHVTAENISVSSASNVTVQYANIGYGSGDGLDVTSDRGTMVRNVVLAYNYVHDPRVPDTAHYDGIQVRGVDGLAITCSVFDAGPYQPMYNAGIYLEDANGGDSNITVARNWVYGFGFSVMMDAVNTTLDSNRIGGDIHWGPCRLGERTGNTGLSSTGNVWDPTGASLALCTQG